MTQPVVRLDRVSKCYYLSREPYPTLKEKILRAGSRRARSEEFYALMDVSFEVFPGEILGIIGDNGSGMARLGNNVLHTRAGEDGDAWSVYCLIGK